MYCTGQWDGAGEHSKGAKEGDHRLAEPDEDWQGAVATREGGK